MRRALPFAAAGLLFATIAAHDLALAPVQPKAPARHARRVGKHTSLTGLWSGVYFYPYPMYGVESVPFNARLEETGESFTGESDEPNTYAADVASRLFARISGARRGSTVSFIKTMDGTGGASHSIAYDGVVDADLTRIDGGWRIPGDWSGKFFMERAGVEAEAAVTRAESTEGHA